MISEKAVAVTYAMPDGIEHTVPVEQAFVQRAKAHGYSHKEWFLCGKHFETGKPFVVAVSMIVRMGDWEE